MSADVGGGGATGEGMSAGDNAGRTVSTTFDGVGFAVSMTTAGGFGGSAFADAGAGCVTAAISAELGGGGGGSVRPRSIFESSTFGGRAAAITTGGASGGMGASTFGGSGCGGSGRAAAICDGGGVGRGEPRTMSCRADTIGR